MNEPGQKSRVLYEWRCARCDNPLVNVRPQLRRGFCPGCRTIRRAAWRVCMAEPTGEVGV